MSGVKNANPTKKFKEIREKKSNESPKSSTGVAGKKTATTR